MNLDSLTVAQARHEASLWGLQGISRISKTVCLEYIRDCYKENKIPHK